MLSLSSHFSPRRYGPFWKHCQRHNGPEGWVLLTKETSSYTNLDQIPKFKIFRPNFNIKILTKHSLHNLTKPQQQNTDQTSVSKLRLNLNFKILTKPSFRISTKIKPRNLNQVSTAKYWPNFSFKILPELQLQTPDQTLCWKSEQKFSFVTKPQLPNLQQTVANIREHVKP